jgi:hypothetical protein
MNIMGVTLLPLLETIKGYIRTSPAQSGVELIAKYLNLSIAAFTLTMAAPTSIVGKAVGPIGLA